MSGSKSYSNVQYYGPNGLEIVDLTISDKSIKKKKSTSKKASAFYLIPSFIDLHAVLGEPGNDLAENLGTFKKAAQKGGFQSVWAFSNRFRNIIHKEDVLAIKNSKSPQIKPVVNASVNEADGWSMSNLYELAQAGANVSYLTGIDHSGEVQRTHQYINNFGGLMVVNPHDSSFKEKAEVAETEVTTRLGFSGSPDMAEFTAVQKLLEIANYNCAPIHIQGISTKQSIEAISKAKKRRIQVTCDVSIFSLCYTDEDLQTYNSQLKLRPYLRTKEHQKALFKGIKDGTIDAIASYHHPCTAEQKQCEFNYADFGAISFQTFLPLGIQHVIPKIGWDKWVEVSHTNPKKIAQVESKDNWLLVSDKETWTFDQQANESLAQNSPCFNEQLKGKIIEMI